MVEPAATKEYRPTHTPVTSGLGLSTAMTLQLMTTATRARDGNTASRGNNTLILPGSFCRVAHPVAMHVARHNAANVCTADTYTLHGHNSSCTKPGTSDTMI